MLSLADTGSPGHRNGLAMADLFDAYLNSDELIAADPTDGLSLAAGLSLEQSIALDRARRIFGLLTRDQQLAHLRRLMLEAAYTQTITRLPAGVA